MLLKPSQLMHIILRFFKIDLIFLLLHLGVEVAFGAGFKELFLIMLVSLTSQLQSCAKVLDVNTLVEGVCSVL